MSNLIGKDPNQIPTNGMLGSMAFQDASYVDVDRIGIGTYGAVLTSPNGTRYRLLVDNSGNLSTTSV
jgi:hypothetical protein